MKCPLSTKLFLVAGKCLTVPGQRDEKKIKAVAKVLAIIQVIRKKLEVSFMNNLIAWLSMFRNKPFNQ